MIIKLFFTLITLGLVFSNERKLSPSINPQCYIPDCNRTEKVFYIRAVGINTTIHHVWDFTKKPTFLIAVTDVEATMEIDWARALSYDYKTVNFNGNLYYTVAVVVTKIYEINDVSDSGILTDQNTTLEMDTEHFNWKIDEFMDDTVNDIAVATVKADGYNYNNISKKGLVTFKASVYGTNGRSNDFPHLLHNSDSIQVELILDNFMSSFQNSRYACQFVTFSTNSANSSLELSKYKTIDDENTPGIFTVDALSVKSDGNHSLSSFLQWKPVVYTYKVKDISNSTISVEYNVTNVTNAADILRSTLVHSLYGDNLTSHMIKAENISFGETQDGFYRWTNYSSWTFVVGIGDPLEEPISMFVVLVLAFGLGIPTAFIIFGVLYIIRREVMKSNDHLFLTR